LATRIENMEFVAGRKLLSGYSDGAEVLTALSSSHMPIKSGAMRSTLEVESANEE
jgi:hypothetical protein